MAKLHIIVTERIEEVGDDKTMVGYQLEQGVEGMEEEASPSGYSFMPILAIVLPQIVITAIREMQNRTGGKTMAMSLNNDVADGSTTFEEFWAQTRASIPDTQITFPDEL